MVQARKAPAFYRGAVPYAFNSPEQAEKELRQVIESQPGSDQACDSRELLAYLYWRAGQYRRALSQLEALLKMRPDAADVKAFIGTMRALAQFPEQSVSGRRHSKLPHTLNAGNFGIPVAINGQSATYMVDTGANFPVISTAEARRRGLRIRDGGGGKLGDSVVYSLHIGDIALADQITVGGLRFRNVAFLVIPDDRFADIPPEQRGILGLPVLLAFRTLRWNSDGTFEIAFPSARRNLADSNLCFDGAGPVTRVRFGDHRLDFALDTGAVKTDLYPRFAEEFASLVQASGKRGKTKTIGVGGTFELDSITLPELVFQVGGSTAFLRPAHVLPKGVGSKWHHGNLGLDLLNQARTVTIDFDAMVLALSKW